MFHKENGGVSSARNVGLDNAKGEWITFLDSDDMFESECLSKCLFYARKYELNVIKYYLSGTYLKNQSFNDGQAFNTLTTEEYLEKDCNIGIPGFYWRTFVGELRFNVQMKYAEDQLFVYSLINQAGHCGFINEALYYYRANEMSATKAVDGISRLKSCKYLYDFAIVNPIFKERINKTIVALIVESCSDYRVPFKDICAAVKSYNIQCPNNVSRTIKTFCYLQKVSVYLAAALCRLRGKF